MNSLKSPESSGHKGVEFVSSVAQELDIKGRNKVLQRLKEGEGEAEGFLSVTSRQADCKKVMEHMLQNHQFSVYSWAVGMILWSHWEASRLTGSNH